MSKSIYASATQGGLDHQAAKATASAISREAQKELEQVRSKAQKEMEKIEKEKKKSIRDEL